MLANHDYCFIQHHVIFCATKATPKQDNICIILPGVIKVNSIDTIMIIDIIVLILSRKTTESHSFCVDVVNKRIIKQQGMLDMKQQPTTKCCKKKKHKKNQHYANKISLNEQRLFLSI